MKQFLLLFLALLCTQTRAGELPAAQPYALENTAVYDLPSKILKRNYQLFVSFPDSYKEQTHKRYPVLFVTDANYAFPLLRSIARRVGDHGANLEDFVLIGLSYAQGDSPTLSRNRDYTPTKNLHSSKTQRSATPYGEAENYRRYVQEEVFPFVAQHLRVDMQRKVFFGHSYGALFGSHVLTTAPQMFSHYLLSSPSLWFDKKYPFKQLNQLLHKQKELPAQLYFMVGEYEAIRAGDARYNEDADLVADMHAYVRQLQQAKLKGLSLRAEVIAGEDHLSVNPISYTRGLLWAFPATKKSKS